MKLLHMKQHASKAASCVNNFFNSNVKLNDNQKGALISFTYNLGCTAVKGSSLVRRINEGEDPNTVAAEELPKFVYAGGEDHTGTAEEEVCGG